MLMDIECGRGPEETKKEKQPKQKKTNEQKRIIAAHIAMYCICASLMSTLPGFIVKNYYNKDINALDNKQHAIYEEFMTCEEFSDSFKTEFTKASNDYANGLITYEEFDEKVKHLNSVKYAQEVLATSNNTELKTQVEDIDKQKQERTKKYQSNPVVNAGLIGLVGIGTASIGAMVASTVYGIKDMIEEKRKNENQICKDILNGSTNGDNNCNLASMAEHAKHQKIIQLKIENDDSLDSLRIVTEEQEDQNTL